MKAKRAMAVTLVMMAFCLAGCGLVVDSEGLKVGIPSDFAQATHIAQMSDEAVQATRQAVAIEATRSAAGIAAQATAQAIAHEKAQAEADQVRAQATIALSQAKSRVEAQPAQAQGLAIAYRLGYVGLSLAAIVLTIGAAFGIADWIHKRATTVYPNAQGQFPLLPERGPGYTIYHDPNRALGPGTVLKTPGLLERASYAIALARGKAPALEPGADYPQPADVPTMLQVTSQAQASQLQIAERSNRPKVILSVTQSGPQEQRGPAMGRMPPIAFINEPGQIEDFERKLLESGDR